MNHNTVQLRPGEASDRNQHDRAIERIVEQTGVSGDEVRSLYQSTLERYQREARIGDFLSIFVSREVKNALTRRMQRR